jgi:hypothetical protein
MKILIATVLAKGITVAVLLHTKPGPQWIHKSRLRPMLAPVS